MHRRQFVSGLSVALAPPWVQAQPLAKRFRVGLLSNYPTAAAAGRPWGEFIHALQRHGFVEGKSIAFELRNAEGTTERLPELAADLVRLDVDVIVVGGSAGGPGVRATKDATKTIPIVMAGVTDPVAQGFITSLSKPGGNVTGIADFFAELDPKRLELLTAVAPGIVKVTLLITQLQLSIGPAMDRSFRSLMARAAESVGVRLSYVLLDSQDSFKSVTAGIVRDRPHALLVSSVPLFFTLRKEIADFAIAQRLPTASSPREMASAGILLSYGSDLINNSVKAGELVAKILKGARPGDLPVEQPDKFELVLNLHTAKALGLTLPRALITQADELIT